MNGKALFAVLSTVPALLRLGFFVLVYQGLLAADGLLSVLLLGCAALVWVFMLMPGRFMLGQMLRQDADKQKLPYIQAVMMGLVRLGRGLLYGLPVGFVLGWVLRQYHTVNGQEFGRMIKRFSWVLLKAPENTTPDVGMMGFLMVVLLLGMYFVLGWRQDMAMEYTKQSRSLRNKLSDARQVREKGEGKLGRVSLVNALLMAVSFVAVAAVVLLSVWPQLQAADGLFALAQTALEMLDTPLPLGTLIAMALVYLMVCQPLCMLRKMRLARAVQEMERRM